MNIDYDCQLLSVDEYSRRRDVLSVCFVNTMFICIDNEACVVKVADTH